jgi:hypothetical protein
MLHICLMQRLLWVLSFMFGSVGIFILCSILIGQLSPAHSAHAVIFIGSAIAIVWSLPR